LIDEEEETNTTETKHPIILDGRNKAVQRMVHYHHVKNMHYDVETLLNELKQRFYITKERSMVKSPQMGNLPDFRLTAHSQPFAYTGLDFFGPITKSIERQQEKRWGEIFTCLNSRPVHIELAASLSTDSVIMAIRRFRGRRGRLKEIHCDNRTNFKGAETELRTCCENLKVGDVVLALKSQYGAENVQNKNNLN
jgi:hypothetical protein